MEWASYDPSLGRTAEVAVLDTHSVKFCNTSYRQLLLYHEASCDSIRLVSEI